MATCMPVGIPARVVTLANGRVVSALGQGTWRIGDSARKHDFEVAALRAGLAAGMTLIDTAEMYGYGRSERLVGEALTGRVPARRALITRVQKDTCEGAIDRRQVYIVSKVLPENAGEPNIYSSLENSLKALSTDYLDLYLLHWRGGVALYETVACMERLVEEGKIGAWGVSNFDVDDMEELWQIPKGCNCQVNQVLYHPASRGIEYDLLPWMRDHGVALMAYCPLAQAGLLRKGLFSSPGLVKVARRHNSTVAQVILAWDIRDGHTIAIPKSSTTAHALENAAAATLELDDTDIACINRAWPAPTHKVPLDIE